MFEPNRHEPGAKVVLGHTIAEGGMNEGLEVLHILATSPATARFLSRELAVRFVSDNPPAALVNAMAATYMKSDGDISAVLTDDVPVEGVLDSGGLSGEGEDAAGVSDFCCAG